MLNLSVRWTSSRYLYVMILKSSPLFIGSIGKEKIAAQYRNQTTSCWVIEINIKNKEQMDILCLWISFLEKVTTSFIYFQMGITIMQSRRNEPNPK